jgi:hypothetical protein
MKVESIRKNITRNLKEENDRANISNAAKQDKEVLEICRRSPRISKSKTVSRI